MIAITLLFESPISTTLKRASHRRILFDFTKKYAANAAKAKSGIATIVIAIARTDFLTA